MGDVVYLKRRATPGDYEHKKAGVWVLSFADRLGPGVITHDPEQGAKEYNACIDESQAPTKKKPYNAATASTVRSLLIETLECQDIDLFHQLVAKFFLSVAKS